MHEWLKRNSSEVRSWAALMASSMGIFLVTRGTSFQQFGVGLLAASVCLLLSIMLFEIFWRAIVRWLDHWRKARTARHSPGARGGR
jgi:hypothetical protein